MSGNNTEHQGGGFDNVLQGVLHFPGHVIAALKSKTSILSLIVNSKPVQQVVAYEKTHEKEQIDAIKAAGMAEYQAKRAAGVKKAPAIVAAVEVAFESGIAEVKSLGTFAMMNLMTEAAAELGL